MQFRALLCKKWHKLQEYRHRKIKVKKKNKAINW